MGIERNKFYCHKSRIYLKDVDIEKVLVSKKFLHLKLIINTLLVTYIVIIKLSHYI